MVKCNQPQPQVHHSLEQLNHGTRAKHIPYHLYHSDVSLSFHSHFGFVYESDSSPPVTPSHPHPPTTLGSTESDDNDGGSTIESTQSSESLRLTSSEVSISDSVLPYYKANIFPLSPPHTVTPTPLTPSQEQGFFAPGPEGGVASSSSPTDVGHRLDFEQGRIDYTGGDRFDNIKLHLDSVLQQQSATPSV